MGPKKPGFLPVNLREMGERGWESCDFIFVSGDAYVDHPSFAVALISRFLEAQGFRVGVLPQPDWKNPQSYTVLGRPRLAFLVGAGNMDSMVAHYTAARKPRSEDAYSPGGKAGLRPDRATLKYVEGIRAAYKDIPVIIGGIEAGLRRFAHYDYWSDTVRRSILLDSKADILVYGMGERPILEIARRLGKGEPVTAIRDVRGACVRSHGPPPELSAGALRLPDYEAVKAGDPDSLRAYAEHFMLQKLQADPGTAKPLAERSDGDRWVLQNPPAFPLETTELDRIYELPYMRRAHPMYDAAGGVPALQEVCFSLVSSRGCFGGCSFCAITFHQGRALTSRSRESLVREAETLTHHTEFKGYIHDVGGPTANFYGASCPRQAKGGFCPEKECLYPKPCPQLKADHRPYMETLKALRNIGSVKKVFIRSGIRFDYLELDKQHGREFLEILCQYHVSGQLKVAPEHISATVLAAMGKGDYDTYEKFRRDYGEMNSRLGLKQYLVPYFISGHPGSTLEDAIELALYMKRSRFVPDQVQDFYPTPGTMTTVMYRTGLDPRTMEDIYVPRGEREKRLQRSLLQFNHPDKKALVIEALRTAGREDLIGILLT
ncbi:YgiQ family radical SAM protein [Treponema primitia]|uniref:YgiQ family radical SAM protein n=1 Tax=Treponema primitia TaxID=88058 RepID=UPI003980123E